MFRHPAPAAKRSSKGAGPGRASFEARLRRTPQDDGERDTKQYRRRMQACRACADLPHMAMIAAVFQRVHFVRLLP
jgi:hypothetical protein